MKRLFCTTFVLLLFSSNLQAEEIPGVFRLNERPYFSVSSTISAANFSPDGKKVVIANLDNTSIIWDVESGKKLQTLKTHSIPFGTSTAAFSPDGKKIVTANGDHVSVIWDVESGNELQKLEWQKSSSLRSSAGFSPDGKIVVTSSVVMNPNAPALNARFLTNNVGIWEVESGKQLHTQELEVSFETVRIPQGISHAVFSPDSKKIVMPDGEVVRIWETQSGKELLKLEGHTTPVLSALFSPDGKKVVTAGEDAIVRIWDAESGKELLTLEEHIESVRIAVFSPDGTKLVTTSKEDKIVRIWDIVSGKELAELEGHKEFIRSVAFSSDGTKLVTASKDDPVRIWDVASGDELQTLEHYAIESAVFSPDGKKILTVGEQTLTEPVKAYRSGEGEIEITTAQQARIWDLERYIAPPPLVRPAITDF